MSFTIIIPNYIIIDNNHPDYNENTVEKEINGVKFLFKKFIEYDKEKNQLDKMTIRDNNNNKQDYSSMDGYPLKNISGHILYKFEDKENKKVFINYIYLKINEIKIVVNIEKQIEHTENDKIYITLENIVVKNMRGHSDITISQNIKKFDLSNLKDIYIENNNHTNRVFKIDFNQNHFFENQINEIIYNYYIAGGNCKSPTNIDYYFKNKGDGNCLFNSFAQIFHPYDYNNNDNDENYKKVKETSIELRKLVTKIYNDSIINKEVKKIYEIKDEYTYSLYDNNEKIISTTNYSLEEYKNNMSKDTVWGGDDEIKIICKYFDLNSNIVNYNNNIPVLNNPLNSKFNEDENKELHMYPFIINSLVKKDNSVVKQHNNNVFYYPYIFCNIGKQHWELKKHNCKLDFNQEYDKAEKRFEDLKKGIYEDNKKHPNNETQEIANIINAIDVFINSGSSSSTPVEYSDEIVGVVGAVDGSNSSSSSGSSSSTGSTGSSGSSSSTGSTGSSGSSSSTGSTGSSGSSAETKISVPSTKTTMQNFFIKTSYIITKNNQKYLFAEIIDKVSAATTNNNNEIYNKDDITITEFWQNKKIVMNLEGYSIEDGAEKYFVVPINDNNINKIK
jgi:hypothetical protein